MTYYGSMRQIGTAYRRETNHSILTVNNATNLGLGWLAEALVKDLFRTGAGEHFRDGFESNFSRSLIGLIAAFENDAINAIAEQIKSHNFDSDVVYEALKWVGHSRQPSTHGARLNLLTECLHDPTPTIREGAIMGLCLLSDPSALPDLQSAIEREPNRQVREDMQQVVEELATDA